MSEASSKFSGCVVIDVETTLRSKGLPEGLLSVPRAAKYSEEGIGEGEGTEEDGVEAPPRGLEGAISKQASSPHSPHNSVVYIGAIDASYKGEASVKRSKTEGATLSEADIADVVERLKANNTYMLIGHNIKFDIIYLMKYKSFLSWYMDNNIAIWDTMLVDYILSGQTHIMPSLDSVCTMYSLPTKDSKVKEYWEKGISTEDIPEEIIVPYLKMDVTNTRDIFLKQYMQVQYEEMEGLVEVQMRALQATIFMEKHGMYFDIAGATRHIFDVLEPKRDVCRTELMTEAEKYLIQDFNPSSNQHIGLLLLGGTKVVTEHGLLFNEDGTPSLYKSGIKKGTQKTKTMNVTKSYIGMLFDLEEDEKEKWLPILTRECSIHVEKTKTVKCVTYKCSEQALAILVRALKLYTDKATTKIPECINKFYKYVDNLMEYRSLTKEITTYFVGYSRLVWPHDSCIHPSLNHCITVTGRLSCTKPNLQNSSSVET